MIEQLENATSLKTGILYNPNVPRLTDVAQMEIEVVYAKLCTLPSSTLRGDTVEELG